MDPDRWGIDLPIIEDEPYFSSITVAGGSQLEEIAITNDISFRELQALNPALKKWSVPQEGPYHLLVPIGAAVNYDVAATQSKSLSRTLSTTSDRPARVSGWRFNSTVTDSSVEVYRVQPGDTLSSISRMFSIPVTYLAEWNKLSAPHSLSPGQYLRIFLK
jgi:membrane-bound lytic murein transglycosylase D